MCNKCVSCWNNHFPDIALELRGTQADAGCFYSRTLCVLRPLAIHTPQFLAFIDLHLPMYESGLRLPVQSPCTDSSVAMDSGLATDLGGTDSGLVIVSRLATDSAGTDSSVAINWCLAIDVGGTAQQRHQLRVCWPCCCPYQTCCRHHLLHRYIVCNDFLS